MTSVRQGPAAGRRSGGGEFKAYRQGTHRTVSPAETLARARPFLDRLGITRIANVTGLDRLGIPVVMVCRPNARSVAVSQGKGLTLEAAKASGLMEAIETHHAEHMTLPLILGSQADLCLERPLVDTEQLPSVVDSLYRRDRPMLWVEGEDLIEAAPLWLPYELVHANYTLPFPTGSGCFLASTNGLASGNRRIEAIVHGTCEAIERDSTTLWNIKGAREKTATGLDLESVDDPACRDILGRFERADIDVRVWETTSDVGVASFYCLIVDRRDRLAHTADGAGCHPARDIALLRALTEAAQIRMTYITGSREDIPSGEYGLSAKERKLQDCLTLIDRHAPERDFRQVATFESETLEDDLAEILRRLTAVGIRRALAVDLTKPAIGLPVFRVVVPGLEGPDEHPGYVPGARARAALGRRS